MKDEWWLRAAISDDKLVAELLLRLKESSAAVMKPLPPSWGVRLPRSSVEKKRDTPRRSPTTPLSFGGSGGGGCGASPSDGGYEDSSGGNHNQQEARSQPSDRFKSKISASTENPTTTSKRPRRKKTIAELKEEESLLLKERTYLEKELSTLRLTLEERRSTNEKLKRIKLDLQIESRVKTEQNSIKPVQRNPNQTEVSEVDSSSLSRQVKNEDGLESDLCLAQRGMTAQEPSFVLPDLNMTPDEEYGHEGIVGIC